MARVGGALRAVGLASWRDIQTFRSITGQNLFFFILLIALQPESAELFAVVLGLVMIFPLSADPMEKVPRERWRVWPLSGVERAVVRGVSLAFTPLFWIALVLLWRGQRSGVAVFLAMVVGARASYSLLRWATRRRAPGFSLLRFVPRPPGILGALMQLHWREMLATLDPYVALLLVGLTVGYRLRAGHIGAQAAEVMSLVSVIAMSTSAQVLIGMDGAGALRYRLAPWRGWQILLAKNLAWLALVALLVWPLDFVSGFFAGLAVLAVGNFRSVWRPMPQARWRFTAGILWPDGILQIVALFAVGLNVRAGGIGLVALCLLGWGASVAFCGDRWDRRATEF